MTRTISRILFAVADETGLHAFPPLSRIVPPEKEAPWKFYAADRTAAALRELGMKPCDPSDIDEQQNLLDGRIKLISPTVIGGIIGDHQNPDHAKQLVHELQGNFFQAVIGNLHKPGGKMIVAPHMLGMVTAILAAALNPKDVVVVTDPKRYQAVIDRWAAGEDVPFRMRQELALDAIDHVMTYLGAIAENERAMLYAAAQDL